MVPETGARWMGLPIDFKKITIRWSSKNREGADYYAHHPQTWHIQIVGYYLDTTGIPPHGGRASVEGFKGSLREALAGRYRPE